MHELSSDLVGGEIGDTDDSNARLRQGVGERSRASFVVLAVCLERFDDSVVVVVFWPPLSAIELSIARATCISMVDLYHTQSHIAGMPQSLEDRDVE